jgi:hypothetical protein
MKHWIIRISLAVVVVGVLVLAGSCNPFNPLAAAGYGDLKIYWTTNDGKIYSGDLDGENTVLVYDSGGSTVSCLALDQVGNKLYWSEDHGGAGNAVFRANTDGTNKEIFHADTVAKSVAIDTKNEMVYIGSSSGAILRKSTGMAGIGTGEVILSGGGGAPYIALDVVHNDIYWSTGDNLIYRDKIGSSITTSGNTFDGIDISGSITSIVVLDSGEKIYWLNSSYGIIRINTDKTQRETVYPGPDITGSEAIAVDTYSNKIYWTTYAFAGGNLNIGTLDGATPQAIVQNIADGPKCIEIDLWP